MPIHSTSWAFIPLGGYPKEATETCQGKNARFIEEIGSSGGGGLTQTPPPVEDGLLKPVDALRYASLLRRLVGLLRIGQPALDLLHSCFIGWVGRQELRWARLSL